MEHIDEQKSMLILSQCMDIMRTLSGYEPKAEWQFIWEANQKRKEEARKKRENTITLFREWEPKRPFDAGDFASGTWEILMGEVMPTLEKATASEFESIIGGGSVTGDDLAWIWKMGEVFKALLADYIDGQTAKYCIYSAKFFGDDSAKEELLAYLARCGEKGGQGEVQDMSKAPL